MPTQPNPARPPLGTQNANAVLCPPTTQASPKRSSPLKSKARPRSSPKGTLNASQNSRLNMDPRMAPAMAPPALGSPSTDSPKKRQPVMSRFKTAPKKPQSALAAMKFSPNGLPAHAPLYPAPAQSQFDLDLGNFYQQPSGKHALMEPAPIKDLRPAKRARPEPEPEPLPPWDSYPPIIDDGKKPSLSYATLIAMAIVRSPQRRLTLSSIYKWIADTYAWYAGDQAGWQNSIRHNLSLNKSFVKKERPKDDPGKGCYWTIEPGMEHLVLKDKASRKAAAPTAENMPVMSTRLEPSQPQLQPQPQMQLQQGQLQQQQMMQQQLQQQIQLQAQLQMQQQQQQPPLQQAPGMPDHLAMPQSILPALPLSSSQQTQQTLAPAPALMPMISSDATIPASDAATIDDLEPHMYSPLPGAMHSSPPIPRRMEALHNGTPPRPTYRQLVQQSSATKSRHGRRYASMDDSGYISSLESSAMRPHQNPKLLTSDDRPRIKKGRAEAEIARIRGSSYESPSRGRSCGYAPPSSSPLRHPAGHGQMLPPLTPATKLEAPAQPPPSVSPSTNLRMHRQNMQSLVESPYRRASALLPDGGETTPQQTPNLHGDDLWHTLFTESITPSHNSASNSLGFDIHEDPNDMQGFFSTTPTAAATHLGSPAKRTSSSIRRQRMPSSVLGLTPESVTNSARRSASFLRVPSQSSCLALNGGLETPSKAFEGLPSSPSKVFGDFTVDQRPQLESPTKMMPAAATHGNEENAPLTFLGGIDELERFESAGGFGDNGGGFDEEDFGELDMLAGFEKIGGPQQGVWRANGSSGSGAGGY